MYILRGISMFILQWTKTQLMSLILLAFVGILYIREGRRLSAVTGKPSRNKLFSAVYITSFLGILFDGITAFTINRMDIIPWKINLILHLGMFVSYELYVAFLFWYWVSVTVGLPKVKWRKTAYILPSAASILLTVGLLPELECIEGNYTNYSMGKPVYAVFAVIVIYCVLTIGVIFTKHNYIPKKKMHSLYASLIFIVIILTIQVIFPESLVSCIAAAMSTLSIYLNMEDPSIKELEHYHYEMVMGFATLVENKDDNTGGHIRRSSAYAVLIAKKLRKNKKYSNIINKDYLNNLEQAAPMHDIGKIGIPDAVLQKPGKLTDEEYTIMKRHPVIGGKIIKDTFGHLYNGEYENMAYQVAMYHHEKWNGKGYPEGLKGEDIPLCARIMAVADVFDAVSAKRCYRDAMPLEKCYEIISNGKGEDFDPDITDVFLQNKELVEEIYRSSENQ